MKLICTGFFIALTSTAFSQQLDTIIAVSNSFEEAYRQSNPGLIYHYDNISQIHDYSNNWDFDRDGIKDELCFIGTGGAHLYYFLQVRLSTDKQQRKFDFISSDFPYVTSNDTLDFHKKLNGFIVANLGNDSRPTIIVRLDKSTYDANKTAYSRLYVKSKNITINFKNGITQYGFL